MSRRSKQQKCGEDSVLTPVDESTAAPHAANSELSFSSPVTAALRGVCARKSGKIAAICALLVILVFMAFGQTLHFGFVNFDDDKYVYENPHVKAGISLQTAGWAFTHGVANLWHPLTVLTLMLDSGLYGSWAGGFHLTNVLLHGIAAVLLFLVLTGMTGAPWRCALVAALFAVHPLRAESVAWISERKNVLSGVFFMLTLGAYLRYVRGLRSTARYLPVVLCFLAGLLSKPTLVTMPFLLLLLDYWPLRRFTWSPPTAGTNRPDTPAAESCREPQLQTVSLWNAVMEKLPLLALCAACCVATLLAATSDVEAGWREPFSLRAANAIVSYAAYIGRMVCPIRLAVLHPFPKTLPLWEVSAAALLLASVTAAAWYRRRRAPWLFLGWFWYVGMLVPMIGLISPGGKAMAGRYTYLSQIGLAIAGTWALARWAGERRWRRLTASTTAGALLCVLLVATCYQTSLWRDSETLWIHTLECTKDNYVARNNLGTALLQQGRWKEAIDQFRDALRINPSEAKPHNNLGNALFQQGLTEEAIDQFHEALRINPDYAEAHYNLGTALLQQGRIQEAIDQFCEALRIDPTYVEACNNLGNILLRQGRTEEAIDQFREALQGDPASAETRYNLGNALRRQGRTDEAIDQFREALRINPSHAGSHSNLGNALFQQGRAEEAIVHAQKALELKPASVAFQKNLAWMLATAPQTPLRDGARAVQLAMQVSRATGGNDPTVLRTLAAAYAQTGQFAVAAQTAQNALQLANAQSATALAGALRREIKLYEAGRRYEDAH